MGGCGGGGGDWWRSPRDRRRANGTGGPPSGDDLHDRVVSCVLCNVVSGSRVAEWCAGGDRDGGQSVEEMCVPSRVPSPSSSLLHHCQVNTRVSL